MACFIYHSNDMWNNSNMKFITNATRNDMTTTVICGTVNSEKYYEHLITNATHMACMIKVLI